MDKKVLEVAKYIIENNATIEITANHFNLSTSSIKKYINNKLPLIDNELYLAVKLVQSNLEKIGHSVGGKNGIREPKYTEFEALEIAETMIANSLTLKEAEELFKIPTSTIYERIRAIKDDNIQSELDILFRNNKKF